MSTKALYASLQDFEIDDTQIKITSIVQIRFEELTNIAVRKFFNRICFGDEKMIYLQLKTIEAYSNVICEACNNELRSISEFRKDLVFKQKNLYAFVEGC